MLAWAVLYGWFTAGMQGLFPTMVASLTTDLNRAGVRIGMIFSVVSPAVLTGPPFAGGLIQHQNGRYLSAQIWASTAIVAGCLRLCGARVLKTGLKIWARM